MVLLVFFPLCLAAAQDDEKEGDEKLKETIRKIQEGCTWVCTI